jgi:hypothetical protein
MRQPLPALSVRQPWADLIVWGVKDVENRSWPTAFRGRLLIHAGRRVDADAVERLERRYGVVLPAGWQPRRGVLLGTVEIIDCVDRHASRWFQGPWGFLLHDPRELPRPVPWRGRLGLFGVPWEALGEDFVL